MFMTVYDVPVAEIAVVGAFAASALTALGAAGRGLWSDKFKTLGAGAHFVSVVLVFLYSGWLTCVGVLVLSFAFGVMMTSIISRLFARWRRRDVEAWIRAHPEQSEPEPPPPKKK